MIKLKTDYEKWKSGKKMFKASWVIKHYESVTDFNQYKLGKIVQQRLTLGVGIIAFIYGIFFGLLIFG